MGWARGVSRSPLVRAAPVTVLCAGGSDQIWTRIRRRAESDTGPTALGPSGQRSWVFPQEARPLGTISQPTDWSPPRKLERRAGERQVPGYLPQGQTGPETTGSRATFWPQAGLALPCNQAPGAHIWGPRCPLYIFPAPARGLGSLAQGASGLRLRARTLPGQLRALVSGWRVGGDGHRLDTSSGPTAGPTPPPPQPLPSSQGCPLPPPGHCGSPGPRQPAPTRWPSHWFTPPPPNSSWNGTKARG